jgi:hypothetical protein
MEFGGNYLSRQLIISSKQLLGSWPTIYITYATSYPTPPHPFLFAGPNNYALNMDPAHAEQKNYQKQGIKRLESKPHRQKPASYIMLGKHKSQNLKLIGSEPKISIKHITC